MSKHRLLIIEHPMSYQVATKDYIVKNSQIKDKLTILLLKGQVIK